MRRAPRGATTRASAAALLAVALVAGIAAWRERPAPPAIALVPARPDPDSSAGGGGGIAVVFVPGDGWFDAAGARIAARMAQAGVAVVTVDPSRDDAAAALATAVARAAALPGVPRLVLVGRADGAAVALKGYAALPPPLAARIAMVELLGPGERVRAPAGVPLLCVRGAADAASPCAHWPANRSAQGPHDGARVVTLPGGRRLQDDDALIAATLVRAAATAPVPVQTAQMTKR